MPYSEPMGFSYHLYGLCLESDFSIPGLKASQVDVAPDVRISIGEMPTWLASALDAPRLPSDLIPVNPLQVGAVQFRRLRDGYSYLAYRDGTRFLVDQAGANIWCERPRQVTPEDVSTYLLGPVMGLVLRCRGVFSLHAGSMAVDGKALALLGPARSGKSTTAAALALLGYSFLSEDVVPITPAGEDFFVQPGYPLIRLWPKSVSMLFGEVATLPQLAPPWNKRFLDLHGAGYHFHDKPLALKGIYLLGPRSDNAEAPLIQAMTPRDGLVALLANVYGSRFVDPNHLARALEVMGKLADAVPVRMVTPHADPSRVSRLCQIILDDFRGAARLA